MPVNFASRVGRLLSASVNGMVDAMENMAPELVMEQSIREINEAISDVRSELGKVISQQHLTQARLKTEQTRHTDLSGKIEIALTEGREDLAEAAIARLLDIESQIPVMEKSLEQAVSDQKELEGYIDALQARRREMKEELENFRSRRVSESGETEDRVNRAVSQAEQAFDRVMDKLEEAGHASASPELMDARQLAELDELARQAKIRDRLEAFKKSAE